METEAQMHIGLLSFNYSTKSNLERTNVDFLECVLDADKCVTHSLKEGGWNMDTLGSNAQIKSNSFVILSLFVQAFSKYFKMYKEYSKALNTHPFLKDPSEVHRVASMMVLCYQYHFAHMLHLNNGQLLEFCGEPTLLSS